MASFLMTLYKKRAPGPAEAVVKSAVEAILGVSRWRADEQNETIVAEVLTKC